MKIKIAICTSDIQYSEKLVHYFDAHYYDKFTWNIFTELSFLVDFLSGNEVDIVLVGKEMADLVKDEAAKDERIWAYLVDDEEDKLPDGSSRIRKYARADRIYRELLDIYSGRNSIHYRSESVANSRTDIYAFVSAAGGVGTSTIACAMAQSYARFEKILYISLENIGAMQLAFEGENKAGLDEVIFALKSRRKTLELKLASAVSRDKSGVYFLEECRNALDVMELSGENLKELLTTLGQMREYDKVILDVGNGLEGREIAAMTCAGRVVAVLDESRVSAAKFMRYIDTLQLIEEKQKADICSKMVLFYNKILRQENLPEQLYQVRVAGGFPRIENGTYEGIIGRIAGMEMIHNAR
ncbi:MAG: AAA family ATPase [Lachnospiraceae bacterium]|nr:AAA family ATPase [Lachnospiraceae bacterium]